MTMHDPPHPGEFIDAVYLKPNGITGRELAASLDVSPSTLNRILTGRSGVSPEMALRLAKCLGRSPESWLTLQMNHDLWKTRRSARLGRVSRLSCGFASLSDPTQLHGGSAPRGFRRSHRR